jgi:DNA-binding response OmpR family regulator
MVAQEGENRALAAGADRYIMTPFDVTELLSELAALLRRPDLALEDHG